MKKIVLISLAIIWGCSAAEAQKIDRKLRFGFLAGVNQAPIISHENYDYKNKSFFPLLGLNVAYQFSPSFAVQLQPSWFKFSTYGTDESLQYPFFSNSNITLTGFKLPLLFRYSILKNKKFSPIIEAGLAYNDLANSNIAGELGRCGFADCNSYPFGGKLNHSSKPSLLGGIGVNMAVGKINVPIMLRYEQFYQGLEFYYSYDYGEFRYVNLPLKNLSLTVGVLF